MRVLSLRGTPQEIGIAFGESCRSEIQDFYQLRVSNALAQASRYGGRDVSESVLLGVTRRSLTPTQQHDPLGYEELEGIAKGANMSVEQILAMNGLTDFRDVLAWHGNMESFGGCSSFIVQRDRTQSGQLLCGQTWDLATDNMPYVIGIHRQPTQGPQTWSLTTVGCLSLIGMNEHRLAIGTTNVRTTDSRPGVPYLSIIHKALSCRDFESAVNSIVAADRAGAHYYYVCDAQGHAAALECTPDNADRNDVSSGRYVHCNHCVVEKNQQIEGQTPAASSHARQQRLESLIEQRGTANSIDDLRQFLSDKENGSLAICRQDFDGISSNGAVVMSPEEPKLLACHGLPDRSEWIDLLSHPSSS